MPGDELSRLYLMNLTNQVNLSGGMFAAGELEYFQTHIKAFDMMGKGSC